VFDGNYRPRGIQTREQAILSGVVVRVIEGRVSADTQGGALAGALDALLFQLVALGHLPRPNVNSDKHE
jgi:hypothetical protein